MEQVKKLAYLQAVAKRQRAEAYLFALMVRKNECLVQSARETTNLIQRQELQDYIARLNTKIEEQKTLIHILQEEENSAREEWNHARKATKVLLRLKERTYAEWQQQADREEQKQLDEFAASRWQVMPPAHPSLTANKEKQTTYTQKGGKP